MVAIYIPDGMKRTVEDDCPYKFRYYGLDLWCENGGSKSRRFLISVFYFYTLTIKIPTATPIAAAKAGSLERER